MLTIDKAGSYQSKEKQIQVITDGEVIVRLNSDCTITVNTPAKLKLHLLNEDAKIINIDCAVSKELHLTFSALKNREMKLLLKADLLKRQAKIKTVSAVISENKCEFVYNINHLYPETFSEINNYGIGLKDSYYDCSITTKIANKCKDSEAYQNSLILTNGAVDKVRVLPILQMEENQIKAKHACSIGSLDPQQKYYLALRGLSDNDIIKLTAKGYLSNVLREIDDEKLHKEISGLIESQVNKLCLT